jgi:hypothetical protein
LPPDYKVTIDRLEKTEEKKGKQARRPRMRAFTQIGMKNAGARAGYRLAREITPL